MAKEKLVPVKTSLEKTFVEKILLRYKDQFNIVKEEKIDYRIAIFRLKVTVVIIIWM